jgi:hypothetical protein
MDELARFQLWVRIAVLSGAGALVCYGAWTVARWSWRGFIYDANHQEPL